ncbi:ABC transporter substrate-binding protein [Oscillospiraceae bacterium MB08-C2-2]|nr:ABC transporter substrate-binding protein [Oscillospiraceae bacterium MB08-C2-2]
MMKNIKALLTASLLTVSLLAGCSGGAASSQAPASSETPAAQSSAAASASESGETFTIGLAQLVEHPSLNTIRTSFTEELEALGYGADKVTIDYKNGQGEQSTLNSIAQTFVGNQVDLIVAIATPTAQAMASATTEIPILFSAVTDPVGARLVDDANKPSGNITGTSDSIPVESIFALAKELRPDDKTFGLVYNLGEDNSVSVIKETKAYLDANGMKYTEVTVANSSEVQQAVQSLVGRVDAIFSPIDNTVAKSMPLAADIALKAKIPFYTGADSMVEDGGLATVGIDYEELGKKTAQMAVEIIEGKAISELPVATMDNYRVVINTETAEALGLDVSGIQNADLVTTKAAA